MERRSFNALIAGLGLSLGGASVRASAAAVSARVEVFSLRRNDWVPNNPHLPVIVYRNALEAGEGCEAVFARNGWPPQWRKGVYPFHHYHSLGHEVLRFSDGAARLTLGGPGSREVVVRGGDIALLPARAGHCNLGSDAAFTVIGAYPPGQSFDILRSAPTAEQFTRIGRLSYSGTDPVQGAGGVVSREWHRV